MRNLLTKELKLKFVEAMDDCEDFVYENSNPFLIKVEDRRFMIFLKNLSSAYFKTSIDITRIQLPYSEHFKRIAKSKIPFVALGYDSDNDVFVSWNPTIVASRLNTRNNVSLYSRESVQNSVKGKRFVTAYLTTGEKIILFKRSLISKFLDEIEELFGSLAEEEDLQISASGDCNDVQKLSEIKDTAVLKEIRPLLKKNKVLEAVSICIEHFIGKYPAMSFRDWFNIVKKLYDAT